MNRYRLVSLHCALVAALAACERADRSAQEELARTAQEDPGYATDEPARVVPVPDTAAGQTLTGNLAEMNNSGASGVVTVTPRDGQTWIQLSVTGVQPNTQLVPTIHQGRCDEVGELVHQLERVSVEPTGLATANLGVDRPIQSLADGRHSVRVYPEAGYVAPPLACAELPTLAATTPR